MADKAPGKLLDEGRMDKAENNVLVGLGQSGVDPSKSFAAGVGLAAAACPAVELPPLSFLATPRSKDIGAFGLALLVLPSRIP